MSETRDARPLPLVITLTNEDGTSETVVLRIDSEPREAPPRAEDDERDWEW
jgi:hypothetical protein